MPPVPVSCAYEYTCMYRRSSDTLSADVRRCGWKERACMVWGTRQATAVRHVLDRRRERNDGITRPSHQRVLDISHGQFPLSTTNVKVMALHVRKNATAYVDVCNAQYAPPTPTRLSCRVKSRRQCVLNSQLVHYGFGRRIDNWSCWEFIQSSWLQNWKLDHDCRCRQVSTHRPTQLNSNQHVQFSIFLPNLSAVVVN